MPCSQTRFPGPKYCESFLKRVWWIKIGGNKNKLDYAITWKMYLLLSRNEFFSKRLAMMFGARLVLRPQYS